MTASPVILISAGEMSGDQHAARLVVELKRRLPGASVVAFAGDACREAGADLLFHYRDYAVLGITDVLANAVRFLRLERALKRRIDAGVDLFVPVDYPGLNLRLASHARRRGAPVLYYIGPQVWAWGAGRLARIASSVDRVALILPFEEAIYRERGIDAEFVGHPFVADHELPDPLPDGERGGVGLLPGSRVQEVRRILPAMLGAQARVLERRPGERFTVGRSPAVPGSLYRRIVAEVGARVEIDDDSARVMRRSRALVVASGTATLQAALMETPMVIVYKASPLNYFVGRRLVRIPHIGLANVVLGEALCPELIQGDAVADRIAPALIELLEDEGARRTMVEGFRRLRRELAGGRGCARVAEIAAGLLGAP